MSPAWAIREILLRRLYLGEVIDNRVQKRDQWGLKKYIERPENEWRRRSEPGLRLVSDRRIIRSVFQPPRAMTIGAVKPLVRAIVAPCCRRSWK